MIKQLTMKDILDIAIKLQKEGVDLSKLKIYLGNDEELNGVHSAWYCEFIENNGDEENNTVIELINSDYCNVEVEKNENFMLIS